MEFLEWINGLLAPLGIIGQIGNVIDSVTTGLGIPLFTMICGFLMGLIVVRIAAKVL